MPFNTSGLEYHHRFLGEATGEHVVSEETMQRLKQRTVYFDRTNPMRGSTSAKRDLKECRFPLPNGKVCPRMHMEECTYHGRIIPRDKNGQPTTITASPTRGEEATEAGTPPVRAAGQISQEEMELVERDVAAALGLPDLSVDAQKREKKRKRRRAVTAADELAAEQPNESSRDRLSRIMNRSKALRRVNTALNQETEEKQRERQANRWG